MVVRLMVMNPGASIFTIAGCSVTTAAGLSATMASTMPRVSSLRWKAMNTLDMGLSFLRR